MKFQSAHEILERQRKEIRQKSWSFRNSWPFRNVNKLLRDFEVQRRRFNLRVCLYTSAPELFSYWRSVCTGIYAAMAAARYSFDVLQTSNCELSEDIQNLPPELCEIILKEKEEMGWCDVHEELGNLPYCEKQGQITKVFSCPKCNTCKLTGLCVACYKNGTEYHTLVGREEVDELEEKKFVKTWGQTKLLSEINEEFKKACIYYKQREREVLRWPEVLRETGLKQGIA